MLVEIHSHNQKNLLKNYWNLLRILKRIRQKRKKAGKELDGERKCEYNNGSAYIYPIVQHNLQLEGRVE